MNTIAGWWADMPWSTACLFGLAFLIVCCVLFVLWSAWSDPVLREMRVIRRRRRLERQLMAKTRAMLLRRHDPRADRVCYRELQK